MDPYEYLFEKLNIEFKHIPLKYNSYYHRYLVFNNEKISTAFIENFSIKTLYLALLDNKQWYMKGSKMELLINLLKLFPRELESKEHVDLLLTLNGLNEI